MIKEKSFIIHIHILWRRWWCWYNDGDKFAYNYQYGDANDNDGNDDAKDNENMEMLMLMLILKTIMEIKIVMLVRETMTIENDDNREWKWL